MCVSTRGFESLSRHWVNSTFFFVLFEPVTGRRMPAIHFWPNLTFNFWIFVCLVHSIWLDRRDMRGARRLVQTQRFRTFGPAPVLVDRLVDVRVVWLVAFLGQASSRSANGILRRGHQQEAAQVLIIEILLISRLSGTNLKRS